MLGCAFPEAEQGLNVGRNYALLAGIPESVPGYVHEPVLLVGPAGHRRRRHVDHVGHGRRHAVRRRRVDVARAGRRQQRDVQPRDARLQRRRLPGHGPHRRERGLALQREPSGAGHAGRREPSPRPRRHRERHLQGRDRAGRPSSTTSPARTAPSSRRSRSWTPTKARGRAARSRRSANLKPVFKKNGSVTAGNSSQTSDGAGAARGHERREGLEARPQAARPVRLVRGRRLRSRRSWASARSSRSRRP